MIDTAEQICREIEGVQSLFAEYFERLDAAGRLDPVHDAEAIADLNAGAAAIQAVLEGRIESLAPGLRAWRAARRQYPPQVNDFIDSFVSLLESGLRQSLALVDRRADDVLRRREEIRASLKAISEHRQGVSGYKVRAASAPRVIDSKA